MTNLIFWTIFLIALLLLVTGVFAWSCLRLVPPKTLAIPVFLGGTRLDMVLGEGLHIIRPFCSLTQYSIEPRERVPFAFSVSVPDDQIECQGMFGFKLLTLKEMEERGVARVGTDSNYLLLYDEKQKKIEEDAEARLKEMLDELLAMIPAECALSKKMNDALQLAVRKGLKYRSASNGDKTAEQRIIELVTVYRDTFEKKMEEDGVPIADIPKIPIPEERNVPEQDNNARGLERIFLEDYGVLLTINTLALEPNPETAKARSKLLRQRDIERANERLDTNLVLSMIKKVKDDNKNLTEREARDIVMIVQGYYQKPEAQRVDISLTGLENIPPETVNALGKIWATKQALGGKGKGGKKQL